MYRVRHSCRFCGESRNRSFVKHVIEKHYSGAGIRGTIVDETTIANVTCQTVTRCRADSRFATSQWETALLCNDVSYWLGACQWLLGVTPVQSSIAPLPASPRVSHKRTYIHWPYVKYFRTHRKLSLSFYYFGSVPDRSLCRSVYHG